LNATALVNGSPLPGYFTYLPPAGIVLAPGTYTLLAGFTPDDTYDYNSGTVTVTLVVQPATPTEQELYGNFLQITGNQNNFYDNFYTFINTVTIYNPTLTASRPGYVELDSDFGFDGFEELNQTPFPSIPANSSIEVEVGATDDGQGNIYATVYEEAFNTNNPAQAQDSQEIFNLYSTGTGPTGGVPVGGTSVSAPGFSAPPELTNLVIGGPSLVNENSTAIFLASASFGDGSTDTNEAVVWSSSRFSISNGALTAGSVTTDTVVNLTGQLYLRGVSKSASVNTLVVKVQPPQLQPVGMPRNPFRVQLAGTTGLKYALQAATNLGPGQSWLALATNQISSNSVTQFADPGAATNSRRFYRVQVVP
jgi:hypothetical protein